MIVMTTAQAQKTCQDNPMSAHMSTKKRHQRQNWLDCQTLDLEKLCVTIKRDCTSNRRAEVQMIPCSRMLFCNMYLTHQLSISHTGWPSHTNKLYTLGHLCCPMYRDALNQDCCSRVLVPSIHASSCWDNMCPNSKRVLLVLIELSKSVVHMTVAGFISTHRQEQVPHGSFVS